MIITVGKYLLGFFHRSIWHLDFCYSFFVRHNIPPRSLSSLLVQVEELPPFALLLPLVHQSFRLQFDLQPFLFDLEVHPQLYPSFRLQILLFSRMAKKILDDTVSLISS